MRVAGRWLPGAMIALILAVLALALALAQPLAAQSRGVLAGVDVAASSLEAEGRDRGRQRPLLLSLALDRAVPYRAFLVAGPPRLVLDFNEVNFAGARAEAMPGADLVPAIRWGRFRPGWSRMVVELPGPMRINWAEQRANPADTAPGTRLTLRLDPVAEGDFAPRGGDAAASALWDLPPPVPLPPLQPRRAGPLRVMLDPGHGGIDPGAVAGDLTEAALMLTIAEELAAMLRAQGAEVFLTRDADIFVPLERRMTAARAAGADILVSLHADALPEGAAAGTSFYIWNPQSDDRAARQLAMLHDRADLLAGLDLAGTDDEVAGVLMELARTETHPRSEALGSFMVAESARAGVPMHRRPLRGAAFSVLKSPDIPSVLVEVGFLTDPGDRARITDPLARAVLLRALTTAVVNWARDDRIRAPLLRQ